MANLYYLALSDYGGLAHLDDLNAFSGNGTRLSLDYVMTDDNPYSFLRIDDIRFGTFSDVQIHGSAGQRKSLHAEFEIALGGLRIAPWFRPIVKRSFWIGVPFQLST